MSQGNTQALSQEIQQSAKKILKHLDEIEFDDDSQANIKRGSDLMSLLSALQTDESANILQDVNRWTEHRCDSYQKFEEPLLDQVETNQKIAERSTGEAIPILQDQMDEFDMKLINAKSKLSALTENVIHSATDVTDKNKNQGLKTEIPQLQLTFPQPPADNSEEKELSRIEYENEIIQHLRKRQEYFLNALRNFDKEISDIQEDLRKSREDVQKLKNENTQLKKELEGVQERPQLSTGNEIKIEIDCISTILKVEPSQLYQVLFNDTEKVDIEKVKSEKVEIIDNSEKIHIEKIDKYTQKEEKSYVEKIDKSTEVDAEKTDEYSAQNIERKLREKMAKCQIMFFSDEDINIEQNDEYVVLPRSEAADYFNYVETQKNKELNNSKKLNEEGSEVNTNRKFQYTNHDSKNLNRTFDPSSNSSEISYEMKLNDKGEVVFDLTDGIGNNVIGNFSPESAEEIHEEVQKDIQHLIAINSSAFSETQSENYQTDSNTVSQNSSSTSKNFDASNNKNANFLHNENSMDRNLNGKVNFPFDNPNEGPQPIVPIGIRPSEDQNGDVSFRIFFKQNNDALVLDTNVKQRTKDGLIVLNSPSPNILIRIENGFSSEFITRCRKNPNLNFILRPYRPEGSKKRVVGLCENNSEIYRSNFFKGQSVAHCVWSSFPVRPPPPIYRSSNRPQTNHVQSTARNQSSSLDPHLPSSSSLIPKDIPYLSPQQLYQMRRSTPSSILPGKNIPQSQDIQKTSQLSKIRHSYTTERVQFNQPPTSNAEASPSPRKILQVKNAYRIISPDSKTRILRQRDTDTSKHKFNSIRKLNRPNEM